MPVAQLSPIVLNFPPAPTDELQTRIDHALKGSPHFLGSQVTGTNDAGVVVIQGCVDTFYHKQVAQELLRRLDGVARVVNLLEVHWREQPGH